MRYMISNLSVTLEELREAPLPVKVKELRPYKPSTYLEKGFETPSGKLELSSELIRSIVEETGRTDLDPLPTYRSSFDDADPEQYPPHPDRGEPTDQRHPLPPARGALGAQPAARAHGGYRSRRRPAAGPQRGGHRDPLHGLRKHHGTGSAHPYGGGWPGVHVPRLPGGPTATAWWAATIWIPIPASPASASSGVR